MEADWDVERRREGSQAGSGKAARPCVAGSEEEMVMGSVVDCSPAAGLCREDMEGGYDGDT